MGSGKELGVRLESELSLFSLQYDPRNLFKVSELVSRIGVIVLFSIELLQRLNEITEIN